MTALHTLAETIRARRTAASDASYTRQLLDGGVARCAQKLGEESCETIIAALSEDDAALVSESADLVYHLLVLLEARDLSIDAVLAELERRAGQSGLDEKAARHEATSG